VGSNWFSNSAANGNEVTARFDTLNLTADTTVTLDGARTIGGLKFGDTTPSNNWALTTGSGGPLTLAVPSGSPAILVANQTTTVNAVLAGNQGLLKSGAGTLALGATNTLTGNIVVSQGRLALNSNTALPNTANIVIGDANSGATAPNLYLGNQLNPTFATLTVGSGVAGAKLHTSGWAPTVSGLITLNSPLIIQQYNGGGVHTGLQNSGKITGPGAGAGNDSLIFSYSGGTNFYWQANNTAANDFSGNIRVTGTPGNMNAQGGSNGPNNVVIPDAAMVVIDSGCAFCWNNFGNNAVVETFDGLAGAGNMIRNNSGGLISSLSLTINASNPANAGQRNFTGSLSSLNSFTFTGTGTQVFGGANSYTGPTAVNGGTLLINGSQANTPTTVAAAGTLGGTGTIAGSVSSNGTLAPGNNGVGNLTINNAVTLAAGSKLAWEVSNWTGAAGTGWDKLTASSISITATSGNPILIKPVDLALANFSDTDTSFIIAQTTSGITGFSADKFTVDPSGLTVPPGTWAVQQSGNNLVLAYIHGSTAETNPDANDNGILDTWETANFGNANAGANPPNADPDGDGLSNLMEYALGTHPLTATANPLVYDLEPLGDGKHLRLTVPKNTAATNVTYAVETCGALNDWSGVNTTVETNNATQLTVRDNFTSTTASRRFIRLRVEVVAP
jgi:autotransporter-associated beta strand protein